MAATRAVAAIVTVAALLHVAIATRYTVGGPNGGWNTITDLQAWASTKRFAPGDSLIFTYTSSHDVLEVTKAAYDACSATTPMESHTGGNTAIKLSAPGKRYFICGVPGHCAAGMKLDVDVISTAVGAPPPKHHYPPAAPKSTSHSPSEPPMVAPSRAPSASFPPMSHAPGVAPSMTSAARGCMQCANLAVGLAMGVLLILAA
ncbi:uclacyanin 1-like [Musa acuminata AAA Group]|uniref:uclacyanin 1-like n=1 Tax=Musa acuminata AAA Group TaxID=214697 RepID=UPI0031E17DEF